MVEGRSPFGALRFGKRPVLEHRTSGLLWNQNAMQAYDSAEGESSVTADDCTDLSARAVRALTETMTVLPDTGRVTGADDLYLVVSESGSGYLVDAREGACECPDATHRDVECKHQRRVAYATGETPIPEWVDTDAIDSHLGEQTDRTPVHAPAFQPSPPDGVTPTAQTDGGVTEKAAETTVSEGGTDTGARYTYHYEPAHVGGARYVRCTECGAECIPAKPEQMLHREGCSEGDR